MMGTLATGTFWCSVTTGSSSSSPSALVVVTVCVTSTYIGALYVRLRSRASLGKSVMISPSGSAAVGLDR